MPTMNLGEFAAYAAKAGKCAFVVVQAEAQGSQDRLQGCFPSLDDDAFASLHTEGFVALSFADDAQATQAFDALKRGMKGAHHDVIASVVLARSKGAVRKASTD